jgi:flagellar protein FliS
VQKEAYYMGMGGYQAYQQTDVITADPKRLVIMCYEEAIRNLNLAALMYPAGNFETKAKCIQKALDIISELRETLDFERGGIIATSLETLYTFMVSYLIKSDQTRNVKGFQQVASMLDQLKSAWEKVFFGRPEEPTLTTTNGDLGFTPSAGTQPPPSLNYVR